MDVWWWKNDKEWVTKCMEIRVEVRIQVERKINTWLENVEADMAELEIDREYIHDRKQWRWTVMKRKYTLKRKRTVNRY